MYIVYYTCCTYVYCIHIKMYSTVQYSSYLWIVFQNMNLSFSYLNDSVWFPVDALVLKQKTSLRRDECPQERNACYFRKAYVI